MCGISGIISKSEIKASFIKKMNDEISHRGPDDEGFLLVNCDMDIPLSKYNVVEGNTKLAFGHRRLSIIDLSDAGHQPMSYLNRYWIVFNGEIFNYIELKDELLAVGYRFSSDSDTEVIMAAYDHWGSACLNKFNGMWAFCLYDTETNKVLIARDRFGIKPFYYYKDENNFIFASEIKAILQHPKVAKTPNMEYLADYLNSGSKEYYEYTAYENIFRIKSNSYLECDANDIFGNWDVKKYWTVNINDDYEDFNEDKAREYSERYYELLNDSVKLRLRADVKVGSALSGGLDSSSVVYLINQQLKALGKSEIQETFSSVYKTRGTEENDESVYIDEVAELLKVNSNQIEPKAEEVIDEFEKFIYFLDTPAANTLMSSWHTYKLIKRCGVTVTLDGQGADEQLAGYIQYLAMYLATCKPKQIISNLKSFNHVPGANQFMYKGLFTRFISIFLGKKKTVKVLKKYNKEFNFYRINSELYNSMTTTLETLFHYADRGSMAHSIESRMPFMDYRLVEFLFSVPATYKLHDGWTKYIARKAFDKKLPDNITWRKDKMGWPIPEKFWFEGMHKDYFSNSLNNSKLLKEITTNSQDNYSKNIRRLVLSNWEKVNRL